MRKIAAGAVILFGAAALLGAGRNGTYQGGTYGQPGLTYRAGGGGAGWDTFTVIFTTQDVLTKSLVNPTSIDTSLVWGKTPNTFVTPAAADFARRLEFTQRLALADSVHQIGTGDSTKVKAFAYGVIDSTARTGYIQASGYLVDWYSPIRNGAGPYTINRTYLSAERRPIIFYVPFEKYIPSGSTIVSAYLNIVPNGTTSYSTADSLTIVLNNRAADNKWYTVKGVGSLLDYAHASWRNQIDTKGGAWSGTASDPWVPAIPYGRTYYGSWGAIADESTIGGNFTAKRGRDFSIKNCVQAIVSGATNNGLWVNTGIKTDIWDRNLLVYAANNYSNSTGRTPYFSVTYIRRQYVGVNDITPPDAPSGLQAIAGDQQVYLLWNSDPGAAVSNVYRYFAGSADTTLVGTSGSGYYVDTGAVNGSEHFYFVTSSDASNNESQDSDHVSAYPVGSLAMVRPPYYAMWFQDPPEYGTSTTDGDTTWTTAERAARIDSLAAFDAIVLGPFASEGPTSETSMPGFLADIRAKNPDIIVLQYAHPWILRTDGHGADRSPYKRMKSYADSGTSGADSLGYNCNSAGQIVRGSEYPLTRSINFMRAGAADSVAFIWAEAYEKISGLSGEYTGLFLDDVVIEPAYRVYPTVLSGTPMIESNVISADRDTVEFARDDDEKAAFQTYQVNFVKALRREFAERGLQNRIIVANSGFGRTGTTANTTSLMSYLDGAMIEGPNLWWPGYATSVPDTVWDRAFAMRDLLTHTQIWPPMQMFQMRVDSNAVWQHEILALAYDSWVSASGNTQPYGDISDMYGNHHVATLPGGGFRNNGRLPVPGIYSGYEIADGGANSDTLTVDWSNYTARMIMGRNSGSPDSTYAVWPYVIYDGPDTLSSSAFW